MMLAAVEAGETFVRMKNKTRRNNPATKKEDKISCCLDSWCKVYIPLIDHFLALKMGEIWSEVIEDVNISGVFPTAFDGHVVCTLLDEKSKWASRIKTMQENIISMQQEGGAGEEKKLYSFLRSCQQPSALEAVNELEYVARTSFQKFQKQKKYKQIEDLKKSSPLGEVWNSSNIHRTFLFDGHTTFMNFKHFWIKSEQVNEETEDLPLVSPLSLSENFLNYPDDF